MESTKDLLRDAMAQLTEADPNLERPFGRRNLRSWFAGWKVRAEAALSAAPAETFPGSPLVAAIDEIAGEPGVAGFGLDFSDHPDDADGDAYGCGPCASG